MLLLLFGLSRNSTVTGGKRSPQFQDRIGVVAFGWKESNRGSYRFSAFCVFFVRVFCSTPKNKREFARRLSFGRKYAKNKSYPQGLVYQELTFRSDFFVRRNAPFRHVIWSISGAETRNITPWNRQNRRLIWALSECCMNLPALHNRVCDKTLRM